MTGKGSSLSNINDCENILARNQAYQKAQRCSVEIVNYAKSKQMASNDYQIIVPIYGQISRSSTSVAANLAEGATPYITTADRINKILIAYKENLETLHWLQTLYDLQEIDYAFYSHLKNEYIQISRILFKTVQTLKGK